MSIHLIKGKLSRPTATLIWTDQIIDKGTRDLIRNFILRTYVYTCNYYYFSLIDLKAINPKKKLTNTSTKWNGGHL